MKTKPKSKPEAKRDRQGKDQVGPQEGFQAGRESGLVQGEDPGQIRSQDRRQDVEARRQAGCEDRHQTGGQARSTGEAGGGRQACSAGKAGANGRPSCGPGTRPGASSGRPSHDDGSCRRHPRRQEAGFKVGELVVYPAHGVGKIVMIEEQEIAGAKLELYIVDFEKEKLRLKVPTGRAEQKGMRRLSDKGQIEVGAQGPEGPRPHQAHHVVAPGSGV